MATAPVSVERRVATLESNLGRAIKEMDTALRALEVGSREVLAEIVRTIAPLRSEREAIVTKLSKKAASMARQNRRGSQFIEGLLRQIQPRRPATRPQADG